MKIQHDATDASLIEGRSIGRSSRHHIYVIEGTKTFRHPLSHDAEEGGITEAPEKANPNIPRLVERGHELLYSPPDHMNVRDKESICRSRTLRDCLKSFLLRTRSVFIR